MKSLRIGLIGAGRISDLHVPGYQAHQSAEIFAVCDPASGVAKRRASEWNATRYYTDYRDLLDDVEVDAVEILTPHNQHAPIAIAALNAGKHTSVQKPMCLSLVEADQIIDAAQRSNRVFRVIENFRYYQPLVKAKELLDAGAIGEPLAIRIKGMQGTANNDWVVPEDTLKWRFDTKQSGGGRIVFDYSHHMFATALHLLGPIERVVAWIGETENSKEQIQDSPLMMMWKYMDDSKHGSLEVLTSEELVIRTDYYPNDEWFEISGTRGFIWVNRCSGKVIDKAPVALYTDGQFSEIGLKDIEWDWADSFRSGTIDFVDAILEHRQPPLSALDAREVIKFARAAQMSSREHREVRMEEIA